MDLYGVITEYIEGAQEAEDQDLTPRELYRLNDFLIYITTIYNNVTLTFKEDQ